MGSIKTSVSPRANNFALEGCDRLGMTPTSRGALGLDIARARGEALRQQDEPIDLLR